MSSFVCVIFFELRVETVRNLRGVITSWEPKGLGFPVAHKERFRVSWTHEMGTGGIDGISPRAQAPIFTTIKWLFRSFFNKQPRGSHHLHLKSSVFAKLNPKPILDLYPMHLNNLLLRIELAEYCLYSPLPYIFQRENRIWLRRLEWSVVRVSLTPKPSPMSLGDHVGVPLCYKISGRRAVL